VAIAAILGLFCGLGLAFLVEYFDNTVNSPQDVEDRLGLPVWGTIKTVDFQKKIKLGFYR